MPHFEHGPELWSDFDGTGVHVVESRTGLPLQFAYPRNWAKWPLKGIEGYSEFLKGVQESGVNIAGVVSRRQTWRRGVTRSSMAKLGVSDLLPDVQLLKTEEAKGRFVAQRTTSGVVGMLEDKPHKLVPEIVQGMLVSATRNLELTDGRKNLVLGVVDHSKSEDRIAKVKDFLTRRPSWIQDVQDWGDGGLESRGTSLTGHFGLLITPLEPYSREAGQSFGELVHNQDPDFGQQTGQQG